MTLNSDNVYYYNKDVVDLFEASVHSVYNNDKSNNFGFSKCIKYDLFDMKIFPRRKYDIRILDYIFDRFKLNSNICMLVLKIKVADIYNNSNIYYFTFDYNFKINCIIDIDTNHLYVKELYIRHGRNIMKDIIKHAKEKIPDIIKEINPEYYNKNKKKFGWK